MTDLLTPDELLALIVTLGITLGGTETLKRLLRRGDVSIWHDAWPPRAIGLVLGVFAGYSLWPPTSQIPPIWAGVFIGVTAPTLYRVGVALIAKRYPSVAAAITGKKSVAEDDARLP